MAVPFGSMSCTRESLSRAERACPPRRRVHTLYKIFLFQLSPKAAMNRLHVDCVATFPWTGWQESVEYAYMQRMTLHLF
jgi:hypothetical protein